MAKIRSTLEDPTKRVTVRLDRDSEIYYRKLAQQSGKTLSEFLRETLVHGLTADNVFEMEQRMRSASEEITKTMKNIGKSSLPDSVMLSIYTCEAILTKIIEARNIQELYDAQNRAKERLRRENERDRESQHDKGLRHVAA